MAGEQTDDAVEQAAQEAEAQIDELQHHSHELGQDIEQTRKNWERRQDDAQVPGAEPHHDEPADDAGDESEAEGPAADDAGQ